MKNIFTALLCAAAVTGARAQNHVGETEITKWQYGKRGTVSITYDDGSINQFRVAVPIMNRLGLPGTFYINTGSLPGSTYRGKFIGRPIEEIIEEARSIPTDRDNVFERASAARFAPYRGGGDYFTRAGAEIDAGRMEAACKIMDEFYSKITGGELTPVERRNPSGGGAPEEGLTWELARELTAMGHEFSSHMVTHPYVSALDVPNMMYELEKSREEIGDRIDMRSTIGAECPYGTNDDRAMGYAMQVYSVLRNRMALDYMLELHRPSRENPVSPDHEYVQWQRGILTATTLEQMKEWADITAGQSNMWLVLVIHGVDGIGWEAMTGADMDAYFTHIASRGDDLWVATFGDAARYIKERMSATVDHRVKRDRIVVSLDHPLDKELFDLPLTLKTRVDPAWKSVAVSQGDCTATVDVVHEADRAYVMYQAIPGKEKIEIRPL